MTKLQIKPEHAVALVDVPDDVTLDLEDRSTADPDAADAVVVFVRVRESLLEDAEVALAAARRDALAWIAYPKAGQLGTDLNRDSLAEAVAIAGVRPVRQIAIDGVWSALRFRPAR